MNGDLGKNKKNLENHGIDFQDAGIDIVVNVVHTLRKDCIRIISMRKANKRERSKYEKKIRETEKQNS